MRFDLRISHITPEYKIETNSIGHDWNVTIEDEDEFCLLLNRIAIATTQHSVVEFPEVEISWETKRAIVRAIDGQLFYSEPRSTNRKDLKVIPVEVWRLIEGQSMEEAFARPEEDVYAPMGEQVRQKKKVIQTLLSFILFAFFIGCLVLSFRMLTSQPSLIPSPSFVHIMQSEGEILREYADVYVCELREGSMLFELEENGRFTIYELWFSPDRNRFVIIPVESLMALGGLSGKERALLAGESHLLNLGEDEITLHGVVYKRYGKKLETLGEVLDVHR